MFGYLFLLFLALVFADDIPYELCDGIEEDNIMHLVLDPCNGVVYDEQYVCTLPHDTTIKVAAAFTAPFDADRMETYLFADVQGESVFLPETGQNPCRDILPGCPIKANEIYIFRQKLKLWKFYPVGAFNVTMGVKDANGRTITCAKVPIGVQRNPSLIYRN